MSKKRFWTVSGKPKIRCLAERKMLRARRNFSRLLAAAGSTRARLNAANNPLKPLDFSSRSRSPSTSPARALPVSCPFLFHLENHFDPEALFFLSAPFSFLAHNLN
jgi:hypothetical protein